MRDGNIIRGFQEHDRVINILNQRFNELQKASNKVYLQNLTHVMMWDVLIGLLAERGIITKEQFDQALNALHEKTKVAFEAEQKAAAEKKKMETEGKTTVLSETPAIPVVL